MSFVIETEVKQFELPPEDVHRAVCVGVYDLGHQQQINDKKETYYVRKINVTFELADVYKADDTPFLLSRDYSVTWNAEKSLLPKVFRGLMGRDATQEEQRRFDPSAFLGRGVKIVVTHSKGKSEKTKDRTYANIDSILALPKGMPAPTPRTELSIYGITMGEDFPPQMPKWTKDKIYESRELAGRARLGSAAQTDAATSHKAEVYGAFAGTSAAPPKLPPVSGGVPWEDGQPAY